MLIFSTKLFFSLQTSKLLCFSGYLFTTTMRCIQVIRNQSAPRIFLAKWLLENENVTNPYDPSKDSIRDLQWGRNRFPMSKLVPSSSSLARKTKWLKGIEKFLLHNVIFDVSTLLRQRCGFLRAILAECLPYRILTIVQCPLRWGSYAVCKSNNSRNISKRKPWKAEENKKKWD